MATATKAASRPSDTGLGLVEVLLSMVLLTVVLLALVPLQTRALAGVVLSKERQQATGHANAAIEQVRAATATTVGFAAVSVGRPAPAPTDADDLANTTGCPGACRFLPAFDTGLLSEAMAVASSAHPSLLTERCSSQGGCLTAGTPAGQVFTTRLYVTTTGNPDLVTVTAVTSWTSATGAATQRHVAVRTQIASPGA